MPASDEVWRLHNRKDLDCLFFQGFCEEGHYGGREQPTTTRQGIYCCSPSGKFLASVNTVDPKRMSAMLREALAAWKAMPKADRYLDYDPATRVDEIKRASNQYPADGLALRVYSRDMPRKASPSQKNDWRTNAWNVDSLWYRADEARAMLPATLDIGATQPWPKDVVQRLVRHNLVDNVRGQTNSYEERHLQHAEITTTVRTVKGTAVHVEFRGAARATSTGMWPKDGKFAGMGDGNRSPRGLQTALFGVATFDTRKNQFVSFRLAARGTRWGRTTYNFRQDDLDESPIGFAIVLDPDDAMRRVAPAHVHGYGWQ